MTAAPADFAATARAATEALRALFEPTPLLRNDFLSRRFGAEIWLKREDLSPVRSYKIRGAFTAMRKVLAGSPGQGHFVCASAGNHAQGVAFACRHFGVRGTIFMPVTTPQQKIAKTRAFGGDAVTIRLTGDYFDQSLAAAQAFCRRRGGAFPLALRRRRRDRGAGQRRGGDCWRSCRRRRIW
jgi:threonine dehydratase